MASLDIAINRSELPTDDGGGDFSPLPAGDYTTQITGAELKTTKSGTGQYIKVELTVVGDDFQGRKVWGNINIKNDSEKAEEIGRAQLNQLMSAIGLEKLEDTNQLVGKDVTIKLKVKEATEQWPANNEIKAYKASSGGGASASATKEGGEATSDKPPWAK